MDTTRGSSTLRSARAEAATATAGTRRRARLCDETGAPSDRLLAVSRVATVESVLQVVQEMRRAVITGDVRSFADRAGQSEGAVHVSTPSAADLSPDPQLADAGDALGEVSIRWRLGDPEVDQLGDVAWVTDSAVLCVDDGSEIVLRGTLIFMLQRGTWTLAQSHLSLPDGEAVGRHLSHVVVASMRAGSLPEEADRPEDEL